MAQLVARLSGGQEAVSSSLATPTIMKKEHFCVPFSLSVGIEIPTLIPEFTYERSEYYVAQRSNVSRYSDHNRKRMLLYPFFVIRRNRDSDFNSRVHIRTK